MSAISTMSAKELQTVLNWAASEGWNPGINDAHAFHSSDPNGFYLTSEQGEPVAAISIVHHNSENAFLGLYICKPEFRGRGIGFATWTHAIKKSKARSIGLDGVPGQEANYQKSGFVKIGSSLRHVGIFPRKVSPDSSPVTKDVLPNLIELDSRANGYARTNFITQWTRDQPKTRETRILVKNGSIVAFATWRKCLEGVKVGPVIAPNTATACEVISDIAHRCGDNPLIIDLPESNKELRQELEQLGFTIPFVTARMYRGVVPEAHSSLRAIATMELG